MEPVLEVKVTRIGNKWHARLFQDGKVYDEMACSCREDIGLICYTMMRWYDKGGGNSTYAAATRHRFKGSTIPKGRVWYQKDLPRYKRDR